MLLEINGTTEYTVNDAASVATFDRSYSSAAGRREGKSVNMYHRHLPKLQTCKLLLLNVTELMLMLAET